jgi:nucleoside triphosphate pyrophosphatase
VKLPYPVVLASGSPRRRELLLRLIHDFEVFVSDVDESFVPGESPDHLTIRLATEKALAVREFRQNALVIGGDTVVAIADGIGWEILGKPRDAEDARRMLARLSGRTHFVTTGICVAWPKGEVAFADETRVVFRELTKTQIEDYVDSGESLDKAGSYAIQGAAAAFIEGIDGSLTNVVGLPTERLGQVLRAIAKKPGD